MENLTAWVHDRYKRHQSQKAYHRRQDTQTIPGNIRKCGQQTKRTRPEDEYEFERLRIEMLERIRNQRTHYARIRIIRAKRIKQFERKHEDRGTAPNEYCDLVSAESREALDERIKKYKCQLGRLVDALKRKKIGLPVGAMEVDMEIEKEDVDGSSGKSCASITAFDQETNFNPVVFGSENIKKDVEGIILKKSAFLPYVEIQTRRKFVAQTECDSHLQSTSANVLAEEPMSARVTLSPLLIATRQTMADSGSSERGTSLRRGSDKKKNSLDEAVDEVDDGTDANCPGCGHQMGICEMCDIYACINTEHCRLRTSQEHSLFTGEAATPMHPNKLDGSRCFCENHRREFLTSCDICGEDAWNWVFQECRHCAAWICDRHSQCACHEFTPRFEKAMREAGQCPSEFSDSDNDVW